MAKKLVIVVAGHALALTLMLAWAGVAVAQQHDAPAGGHGAEAGGHGHEDHIGLGGASPSVLKPEEFRSDLALWSLVVFLALLAILWKFAWGPISQGLETREHTIANYITDAQRAHEEAKLLLAEHQRQLAHAADEVRALLEEARRDAEYTKQDILAEAKAGADAERVRALREIEAATDGALKQLAERSADLAVELAGKIVSAKLTPADHAKLIQDAVSRFPQGTPSRN